MSMDEGIKDFWIGLMESGKYTFGKEWLNKGGKHDPLGVLCEIAVGCGVLEGKPGTYRDEKVVKYDRNTSSFSPRLQRWAGITHDQTQDLYDKTDRPEINSYQPAIEYIRNNL